MQEQQATFSQDYDNCPEFSDDKEAFAESNQHSGFVGNKIPVERLINRKVIFLDFKIAPSQYRRFGDSVTQVQIVVDGEKRVFFTQSKNITRTLQVFKDKLPRCGVIVKEDRALKIK